MNDISSTRLPVPAAEAAAHSARVRDLIVKNIADAGGWIGFDRYMELALYAPGLGYYTAGARKFGDYASGGDFVTAPELSPLFTQALATQVAQVFVEVEPRIVEFGAGSGVLARDLLDTLKRDGVNIAQYSIVEVAADLRERQAKLLQGRNVQWLSGPPENFEGVLLANEVLDVMPVRLFAKRGGTVLECGVTVIDRAFAFSEKPAPAAICAAVDEIESVTGPLPDGYASEVGLVARAWMRSAADWIKRGLLLVIDYGFPCREYYHPQRRMGTIMCHYRHHAHADPFWLPGLNDITAHVDFSAMALTAHEAGLDVLGYTTQAHFLLNCGLLGLVTPGEMRHVSAVKRLTSEAEMGELVKVLAVGRGIELPLRGFARGDRTPTL